MKTVPARRRKYKHARHVSWRRVGNETVLLDLNTSAYFSLNPVGSLVWEGLGAGRSLREIAEGVCRKYGTDPDKVQKDIQALLAQLLKQGLLQPL